MDLDFRPYKLLFVHPFGVSSNTRIETTSIFVRIRDEGFEGFGEACLPVYLGENEAQASVFLRLCVKVIHEMTAGSSLSEMLSRIDELDAGNNAAKAAIDVALHDLFAKKLGVPVYEMLGFVAPPPQNTSFTIAIDSAEKLGQKILEADDYPILKIKAGTSDDKKLIRQIRKFTYKPLYVDVNQGWRDKHMVLDMIGYLKEQGVLLVEQPMPAHMYDEMAWVTEKSPLPTIADESAKRLSDLPRLKGVFSGINLKLMKSTGIFEALKMIDLARQMDLKVMLGCMAESSCATAAMAQLLGDADFVDLDAPRLYRNDPFTGLQYSRGKINAPDGPGIGVKPASSLFEDI